MTVSDDPPAGAGLETAPRPRRVLEVFAVALGLGLTAFGGPVAHLGYFERTYVQRRRWESQDDFAALVALCQMVPGPASSQLGFLIGLRRAGWRGALAAWAGFTLPSAVIMAVFAVLSPRFAGPLMERGLQGLKLVAVAIVAQAVWSMGPKLCPDLRRTALALAATTLLLVVSGPLVQVYALAAGALGGIVLCRDGRGPAPPSRVAGGRRLGWAAGAAFLALLMLLLAAGRLWPTSLLGFGAVLYRCGALVFGGGHVVLPLLRDALVPRWIGDSAFLAGYGAVQAAPGPLFTFAAYLGVLAAPPGSGVMGAVLWSAAALGFIFAPGLLIATAALPLWNGLGRHPAARGALAGLNATVVGVLGAALYTPIWTNAVQGPRDLAVALVAFLLLVRWRAPPIAIVALCVAAAEATAPLR